MKKINGRPTTYTKDQGEKICEAIREGSSVAKICERKDMPCSSTLYRWLTKNKCFSESYTDAVEHRTHLYAEKRHDLLQEAEDKIQKGELHQNFNQNAYVQLVKEKLRAIEWDAERLSPAKYTKQIQVKAKVENDLDKIEHLTKYLKENGVDVNKL